MTLRRSSWLMQQPAEGKYLLYLSYGSNNEPLAIQQRGQIPNNATTLEFYAWGFSPISITLDSMSVRPLGIARDVGFGWWGVDVSSFQGKTVTLQISAKPGGGFLDGLRFTQRKLPAVEAQGRFDTPRISLSSLLGSKPVSILELNYTTANGKIYRLEQSPDLRSWTTMRRGDGTGIPEPLGLSGFERNQQFYYRLVTEE